VEHRRLYVRRPRRKTKNKTDHGPDFDRPYLSTGLHLGHFIDTRLYSEYMGIRERSLTLIDSKTVEKLVFLVSDDFDASSKTVLSTTNM
jgi:hypothetical protein